MTNSTNPTIRIHDLSTNKVVDREMNDKEFATYQADKAIQAAENAALAQKAAEKAGLLNRLGLTEDELKTILG
jgi:predicted methyltransferase MtxX (methanogen marker protein 4)